MRCAFYRNNNILSDDKRHETNVKWLARPPQHDPKMWFFQNEQLKQELT